MGLKAGDFSRLTRQGMVVLTWGVVFRGCRQGRSVVQRGWQSRFPEDGVLEKQEVCLQKDWIS